MISRHTGSEQLRVLESRQGKKKKYRSDSSTQFVVEFLLIDVKHRNFFCILWPII